jgi:hypothetical protein
MSHCPLLYRTLPPSPSPPLSVGLGRTSHATRRAIDYWNRLEIGLYSIQKENLKPRPNCNLRLLSPQSKTLLLPFFLHSSATTLTRRKPAIIRLPPTDQLPTGAAFGLRLRRGVTPPTVSSHPLLCFARPLLLKSSAIWFSHDHAGLGSIQVSV